MLDLGALGRYRELGDGLDYDRYLALPRREGLEELGLRLSGRPETLTLGEVEELLGALAGVQAGATPPPWPTAEERAGQLRLALGRAGAARWRALPEWVRRWVEARAADLGRAPRDCLLVDVAMALDLLWGMDHGEDWRRTQNRLGHFLHATGRPLPPEFF